MQIHGYSNCEVAVGFEKASQNKSAYLLPLLFSDLLFLLLFYFFVCLHYYCAIDVHQFFICIFQCCASLTSTEWTKHFVCIYCTSAFIKRFLSAVEMRHIIKINSRHSLFYLHKTNTTWVSNNSFILKPGRYTGKMVSNTLLVAVLVYFCLYMCVCWNNLTYNQMIYVRLTDFKQLCFMFSFLLSFITMSRSATI